MSAGNVFEDILDDVLLMGSLASEIFVKNPASQATAGRLVTASAQLLQVIDAQLHGTPLPMPAPSTPATGVTPATPAS